MHRQINRKYLAFIARWILILSASITCFIGVVDPHGLIGSLLGVSAGFSGESPDRQAKAYSLIGREPSSVILGTSKAHVGYFTADFPWAAESTYNLGLNDASVYEMRRMMQQVTAKPAIQNIWLSLDMSSFVSESPTIGQLPEKAMPISADGQMSYTFYYELLGALFSWDAFAAALRPPQAADLAYDEAGNGLMSLRPIAAAKFPEIAHSVLAYLIRQSDARSYPQDLRNSAQASELDQAIRTACATGADIYVVFNPVHIANLALIYRLNAEATMHRYKRLVLDTLMRMPAACRIRGLWDFTTMEPQTSEPLPILDSSVHPPSYWHDPNHFNRALGAEVIRMVFGPADQSARRISSSADLREHRSRQQAIVDAWMNQNPEIDSYLGKLIDETSEQSRQMQAPQSPKPENVMVLQTGNRATRREPTYNASTSTDKW